MEDEEGYTMLNLRPKERSSVVPSPDRIQGIDFKSRFSPSGGSGCKLCPTDWRLRGDKCYWVSRENKIWSESRTDCSARGSQLLVIRDPEELSLPALTGGMSLFWVGLSVSSPEKGWTWLDGSLLNQTLFPVSGPAEGNSCGAVKGNRIDSDTCSSGFQWICQRDAIPL
uniref:C-type lectin domain-containing protein n=1 Tax=Chrysemys picta bellii TaxID=8478 RepID=A0A8C3F496_CHRPI